MPAFIKHLPDLNHRFSQARIGDLARELNRFAPGQSLDASLMMDEGTPIHRAFKTFLATLPAAFHEAVNGVVRSALSTTPPTPVTFAWAPAYAPEMTVFDADCGITILIKTPYPGAGAEG